MEVEWKYLLKLDPEESQRPKPSANAKPLPEHLKENDASLDISNRTDGVPEMGDPFLDPNSEHKWAEFHTAPDVLTKVAKVDFSKEHRLWFYLGKSSTEARAQYTHDPSKPQHNPKSNFLDTVKPPPPPIPHYQHRSYPASYPIKPAPVSIPPRTPTQPDIRPYQYRPKDAKDMMSTFRAPAYNPDTRKNPNSPVAHQPNVTYDHRAPVPHYTQSFYQPAYHSHKPPQGGYVPYVPPQYYSNNGKSPVTSGPPQLTNITHYAPPAQTGHALPPYPYQLPPYSYQQGQGQESRPAYSPTTAAPRSQSVSSHNGAPVSSFQSAPNGTNKPSMYAITHPSSTTFTQPPSTQSEYLAYVTKYPYLKNAFLRRAKTYISPYSPNGGFTPEWMPKLASSTGTTSNTMAPAPPSTGQPSPGLGPVYTQGTHHSYVPRPTAQFQSADAFRQDLNKASQSPATTGKWGMFKHYGATARPPTQTTASSSSPQSASGTSTIAPRPSSGALDKPKDPLPQSVAPGVQDPSPSNTSASVPAPLMPSAIEDAPKTPVRPEVSPISDNGVDTPSMPAATALSTATPKAAASASGPAIPATSTTAAPPSQAQPMHTGETWRYTQPEHHG